MESGCPRWTIILLFRKHSFVIPNRLYPLNPMRHLAALVGPFYSRLKNIHLSFRIGFSRVNHEESGCSEEDIRKEDQSSLPICINASPWLTTGWLLIPMIYPSMGETMRASTCPYGLQMAPSVSSLFT